MLNVIFSVTFSLFVIAVIRKYQTETWKEKNAFQIKNDKFIKTTYQEIIKLTQKEELDKNLDFSELRKV